MPIVKTKKAMDTIKSGEVLEVHATDKGALNDFPAWAKSGGHTIVRTKRRRRCILLLYSKRIIEIRE